MVKLLVFAILLASSPATGLLEKLFPIENSCYKGCSSNYAASKTHLDACQKGCDSNFQKENCPNRCQSFPEEGGVRASCEVGCTLSSSVNEVIPSKPIIAVDPVPTEKDSESNPENAQPERPHSIILIRLRQRPSNELPSMPMQSMHPFFNGDPIQMFNDIIKQFQEHAKNMEQSIIKSFDENSKDLPTPEGVKNIQELPKSIPIIRIPIKGDSDSSSSEESDEKRPEKSERHHDFERHHGFDHHRGFEHHRKHMGSMHNRFRQFITDVRTEWNDLVRKQPKIPIWIFLAIFLSSSAILWYMVMTLCHHTPSRDALSIRAQELIFHPYDYEAYEKEKIQPDDQPYEVTESLPIKVKLSNI